MPFIPHTQEDIQEMLEAIGVASIEDLFDEIPDNLKIDGLQNVPAGISELEISQLMQQRAQQDGLPLNFIGAGAYEHHIPAAVWQIVTRGEIYSAYTPYQAEASQGTLQMIYEYQSMMAALTGMEVSNASLYDGASALAEAVLMAVRGNRKSKSKKVLMPRSLHPNYRKTANTIVKNQEIELVELGFDTEKGNTSQDAFLEHQEADITAVVIAQPNFFGALEDVDWITDWAHAHGALVIAVVNPTSLALLKPPGQWGEKGADIVCGEGQPLGVPLSSGGPYFGFMTTSKALVRQMPGRLVGRTVDLEGKEGYALTLQAREQHIRRSKATSNICTNQGLLMSAATIYMALMGAKGLKQVALQSHQMTKKLVAKVSACNGVTKIFNQPYFHEAVIRFDVPVKDLMHSMVEQNISPGFWLGDDYPELSDCMLVCATETKTDADIETYSENLGRILEGLRKESSPAQPKFA